MEIESSIILQDSIILVTNIEVARIVLTYGLSLENRYDKTGINSTTINISKADLGITGNLYNKYFKLLLYDSNDNEIKAGIYYIEVINNKESIYYDAIKLKQELDNLNYYEGIIESLTLKEEFLGANDFFYNYIQFLTEKLYGGSLGKVTSKINNKFKKQCK